MLGSAIGIEPVGEVPAVRRHLRDHRMVLDQVGPEAVEIRRCGEAAVHADDGDRLVGTYGSAVRPLVGDRRCGRRGDDGIGRAFGDMVENGGAMMGQEIAGQFAEAGIFEEDRRKQFDPELILQTSGQGDQARGIEAEIEQVPRRVLDRASEDTLRLGGQVSLNHSRWFTMASDDSGFRPSRLDLLAHALEPQPFAPQHRLPERVGEVGIDRDHLLGHADEPDVHVVGPRPALGGGLQAHDRQRQKAAGEAAPDHDGEGAVQQAVEQARIERQRRRIEALDNAGR